jgi:hypothetical protein
MVYYTEEQHIKIMLLITCDHKQSLVTDLKTVHNLYTTVFT